MLRIYTTKKHLLPGFSVEIGALYFRYFMDSGIQWRLELNFTRWFWIRLFRRNAWSHTKSRRFRGR